MCIVVHMHMYFATQSTGVLYLDDNASPNVSESTGLGVT